MANDGTVNIHGKIYETVALRVKKFREKHPEYALVTEIVSRDDECVVMKATILKDRTAIATGHSEEYRHTSSINKTSALENAETSAIGRALAALGLGGTEFASADEVAHAITGKQQAFKKAHSPTDGCYDALSKEDQDTARSIALGIVSEWSAGRELAAYESYYKAGLTNEMMLGVWELLKPHSEIRNKLKKMHNPEPTKKAA